MNRRPIILLVDDEPFNIAVLEQELEDLQFDTDSAADGREALDKIMQNPPDLVLLDIMMPVMDGFAVLTQLKESAETRDIPVIIISALSDIKNVVRGIELGAEDYLPKPFDSVLLEARVSACLEKKRLRDQETEYLAQVECLALAAAAVESNTFDPATIDALTLREDALGGLARVFQRMAQEVHTREQHLRQQLAQVAIDQAERRQAQSETNAVFVPMDRLLALANGRDLPEWTTGAALFVDVSGFTKLSEQLVQEVGPKRGAEELIRHLNGVLGAHIATVHKFRGSIVSFSGDAMTCWFDGDSGLRAVACALQLQEAIIDHSVITTPSGARLTLGIKAAIAAGTVRRFLAGDPRVQVFEVLAGKPVDDLALAEKLARKGQVTIPRELASQLGSRVKTAAWHTDLDSGVQFGIVIDADSPELVTPWEELPPGSLSEEVTRPWISPAVHERLRGGNSEYVADLRPATALFTAFRGIDFAQDEQASAKLNRFVRWVQSVLESHESTLLQITIGDKGSYFYAVFGAPIAHDDDPVRAVAAALEIRSALKEFSFLVDIQIGIAHGQMRTGLYGGPGRRTYGVQGASVNLAAYLMQNAQHSILCDDATYQATSRRFSFEPLSPIPGKKSNDPIPVFRPLSTTLQSAVSSRLDRLTSAQQLTLKVASVIGQEFSLATLLEAHPSETDKGQIEEHLAAAESAGIISRNAHRDYPEFAFVDSVIWAQTYDHLLFAQRRLLHRTVAEWYERNHTADLSAVGHVLAHHWQEADDSIKASEYFELAAAHAKERGAPAAATRYLEQSISRSRNP